MYQNIFQQLERPVLYQQNKVNFWDEEHISKQMLAAHLNPEYEGASRKRNFIERSVQWIAKATPASEYPQLLDIGCGPGLYAERFAQAGYRVTGLDFSKRSIQYAKDSATKQGFDITYVYQDYLNMDYPNRFDLATFIYCDYGALSTENRALMLQKIYQSLKSGGKLLFDVFSMVKYDEFEECNTWKIQQNGGFWSPQQHLSLKTQYKYSDHVTLEQTVVLTQNETTQYCIWNRYFTLASLQAEAEKSGFQTVQMFGDVTGTVYHETSPTIAILLEKE